MKILVIGGTRFFGKLIVRKFLERGDEVTLFSRGQSRPDFWEEVTHVTGDRSEHADFERKLQGKTFDLVVDNIAYNQADVESAVRAFAGRAGHYLLCSSGSVYRDYVDLRQLNIRLEDDADLDFKGDLDYSEGKRAAEKVLVRADKPPIPFTIIRPPVVQGPEDPSGRAWYWIQRVADGREILVPQTIPSTIFSLACSSDIANAFVLAAGNAAAFGRTYNIAGFETYSLEDYVRATAKLLGREEKVVPVPLTTLRREPGFEKFEPPLSDMRFVTDISAARRDLKFAPTPASEWLAATARWFLEQYKGPPSEHYGQRDREVEVARRWMKAAGSD